MNSLKNFFITYLVSFVVFGIVAGVILWKAIPEKAKETDTPTINLPDNKNPQNGQVGSEVNPEKEDGDSFNALLCCYDDDTGRADAVVLLNADKTEKSFTLCAIPSYLKVNTGTESVKKNVYLGDILIEYNRDYFLKKVEAITGVSVDFYAFISTGDFAGIIDELGGVEFNVPQNMYYENHKGEVLVDLKAGKQKLSGEKALELVRFRSYTGIPNNDDGDAKRRDMQCDFVYTLFESFLKEENRNKIGVVVSNALGLIKDGETNFTLTALTIHLDTILEFSEYEHKIITYPVKSTEITSYETGEKLAVHTPDTDEAIKNVFIKFR